MKPRYNPSAMLTTAELLDAVPMHNLAATCEFESESELVLRIEVRQRWYTKPPLSLVLPFGRVRRVGLDVLGREVWHLCDGVRTVESIVDLFAQKHGLRFQESRISVLQFLKMLTQRGAVVMTGRKAGE